MANPFDEDAFIAAADLVGRSGARSFEVGYLHDNVPVEEAEWYAQAQYEGARLIEEKHTSPAAAAEALARRLLTGAMCAHCGGLVALSVYGAYAYRSAHLVDGTPWPAERVASLHQCHWTRQGQRWVRGCEEVGAHG